MKFSYIFRNIKAQADIDKTAKCCIAYTLPKEAILLERHMHLPPRIHNDDKMKRYLLQCLINNWTNEEDISNLENNVCAKLCQGYNPLVGEIVQPHAIIRFRLVSKLIFFVLFVYMSNHQNLLNIFDWSSPSLCVYTYVCLCVCMCELLVYLMVPIM